MKLRLHFLLSFAVLGAAAVVSATTIYQHNFEDGDVDGWSGVTFQNVLGRTYDEGNSRVFEVTDQKLWPMIGEQSLFIYALDADMVVERVIEQLYESGQTYSFRFDHFTRIWGAEPEGVIAQLGYYDHEGFQLVASRGFGPPESNEIVYQRVLEWSSQTGSEVGNAIVLRIVMGRNGDPRLQAGLDNFQLVQRAGAGPVGIPEPSASTLWLALLTLMLASLRRKQAVGHFV